MLSGIGGECFRGIARRIYGERNHADICRQAFLQLSHFVRHHGARPAAIGENEIRDPNLTLEFLKRDGSIGLIGQGKIRYRIEDLELRGSRLHERQRAREPETQLRISC